MTADTRAANSLSPPPDPAPLANPSRHVDVEIVVPVFNEEAALGPSVERLLARLQDFPFSSRVVIADNASTDATLSIAHELADRHDRVSVCHLDAKGRGRALRACWAAADADVVAYMDVDLSTDLDALLPLVAPLMSGHSDIAIGSRLAQGSRVIRGPRREFISRTYNLLLRGVFGARFSDAQCGFKAVRTERARELLPLVRDDEWFFDTELLLVSERAGLRIHEVPVDWIDDPDSRVDVIATARADLQGMARIARGFARGSIPLDQIKARPEIEPEADRNLLGEIVRFALVGITSTALFAVLFLLFRTGIGAVAANVAALLLATIANTAVNRRFTFGLRTRTGAVRHQVQGFVVLAIALAITSGSLILLHALVPDTSRGLELLVLTAANLLATVIRFLLMRSWIFNRKVNVS